LTAAQNKKNERLYLLMQTICSTGIRVSELRYITVEAVSLGRADIHCKGKQRNRFHKKCPDLAVGAMIQEGKILLTRISRGSSMEIMQIIQG